MYRQYLHTHLASAAAFGKVSLADRIGVVFFLLFCSTVIFTPLHAASVNHGPLPVSDTPQFVSIGFDDNYVAEGMAWVVSMLEPLRNPQGSGNKATFDGTPARVTFFTNTDNGNPVRPGNDLGQIYVKAAQDGNEIGVHTRHHNTSEKTTAAVWKEEIAGAKQDLIALPLAPDSIIGFRAPYLRINKAMYQVLHQLHFAYDASIENGYEDQSDGTDLRWPYALDHGSTDDPKVPPQPGLWEMPMYYLAVPPQLRAQIQAKYKDFDSSTGKMTGLDWNMVTAPKDGGAGFTQKEYLETLKYSLDQRLKGNRAPMLIGAHSQFYTGHLLPGGLNAPNITPQEMQQVLTEFMAYALSKPEVRVVPYRDILTWCKHPVPLHARSLTTTAKRQVIDNK